MTRKQALQEAVEIIQKSRIGKERKENILEKLELCQQELPFAKWTKEAIFDACDQYILDHGNAITTSAFLGKNLPSHPVIQNRFGMTAKEFRDRYYPLPNTIPVRSKYRKLSVETWNQTFIREFHMLRITSMQDYNKRRNKMCPSAITLIRHNNLTTWGDLLKKLGLRCYREKTDIVCFKVSL